MNTTPNTQTISAVGHVLNSKETPQGTFAIVETSASNAGPWGGYVNLRLIRVDKGAVYRMPRSRGIKVLSKVSSIYGGCRGPASGYSHALEAMNQKLAALAALGPAL